MPERPSDLSGYAGAHVAPRGNVALTMRFLALTGAFFIASRMLAQEELPKSDENEALEIEPPLLIQNGALLPPVIADVSRPETQPERLQMLLERAKQNAASGERLWRSGVIAKIQAEERLLKVVRLEADLAVALLERAKAEAGLRHERAETGKSKPTELDQSVAAASETARNAVARRDRAELESAETNLRRQQKLMALGSARKADVERAAEKLARLAQKTN